MSTFHLHARLIEGPLSNLIRDEVDHAEADEWEEALSLADGFLARGFTVWIYDHGHVAHLPGASDYRTVAQLKPDHTQSGPSTPPSAKRGRSRTAPQAPAGSARPPTTLNPPDPPHRDGATGRSSTSRTGAARRPERRRS